MNHRALFEQLLAKKDLSYAQMEESILSCFNGMFNNIQIGAFLSLMRMKGETTEELTAACRTMQKQARLVNLGNDLIDIVGTGGDGKNTFNVSTACSFVVAAAGVKVAKHGNRSVSSQSGSADVLESAGFELNLTEQEMLFCIKECSLVFLFAPLHHPAMQGVRTARKELGFRTFFNLLGPLINPAKVTKQIVGVFDPKWQKPLAEVLAKLGSTRCLIVSSNDGLDEISVSDVTRVIEYRYDEYQEWVIDPEEYGLAHPTLDEILVNSAQESLAMIEKIFSGAHGAARDIVVLNSAAALYCAQNKFSFSEAIGQAQEIIDSGECLKNYQKLLKITQQFKKDRSDE